MGIKVIVDTIAVLSVVYTIYTIIFNEIYSIPKVPQIKSVWWGAESSGSDNTDVVGISLSVPANAIEDLHQRLNSSRIKLLPSIEGVQNEYGINTKLVINYLEYWRTKYNWSERENIFNQYPHYSTQIQGLQIHFVRARPEVLTHLEVVPILLLHGWPSSFLEFYEIIPSLTTPQRNRSFVFDVIVPSLPGIGLSEASMKTGCGAAEIAVIYNNLMKRLGFHSYYVHGGDWGAAIASHMGVLYPAQVLGLHLNLCIAQTKRVIFKTLWQNFMPFQSVEDFEHLKFYPLSNQFNSLVFETGYIQIVPTQPDTIGAGLSDSPVGLAAYILERFMTLTNPKEKYRKDGGLYSKLSKDTMLDNIMLYWFTNSMTNAMRIYSESTSKAQLDLQLTEIPISVPTACAKFPYDFIAQSDSILRMKFPNLVHYQEYSRGGHFPAFEEPTLLAEDIWTAIEKIRSQHFAVYIFNK